MHKIVRFRDLPFSEIQPLRLESQEQGCRFVDRLITEYEDGTNRFTLPGEALFGVYSGKRLIAIGGLNRDPFLSDEAVGRVRHFYVLSDFRRQGVGALLLQQIIDEARLHFRLLTLRTFSEDAAKFYGALGFEPTSEIPYATHVLWLDAKKKGIEL